MSKWFPAVDTEEGARQAAKAGSYGALAFAAMICLGFAFLFLVGHLPEESTADQSATAIGMAVELAVILACAWRFWTRRGLVVGSITFTMFLFEIANKVINGSTNVGWMIFYAAVGLGLINGVRAAWAFRRFRQPDAT